VTSWACVWRLVGLRSQDPFTPESEASSDCRTATL
jgi:hypothetical protein